MDGSKFKLLNKLGEGSFGEVLRGYVWTLCGRFAADPRFPGPWLAPAINLIAPNAYLGSQLSFSWPFWLNFQQGLAFPEAPLTDASAVSCFFVLGSALALTPVWFPFDCSINVETSEEVAIKVLHLETIKDEIENIQKEISLQAKLDPQYVR